MKTLKPLLLSACCLLAVLSSSASCRVCSLSPKTGEIFSSPHGGKLIRVDAFAPTNGTVVLKSIYSADVSTNAFETVCWTNFDWTVVTSNRVTHAVTTNDFANLSWRLRDDVIGVTTNAHPHTKTSSWPVYQKTVAVTNDIANGSAEANVFSSTLATPAYIAPGEKILFNGTATGGWIRLIFE